jgi:hypothetical protein
VVLFANQNRKVGQSSSPEDESAGEVGAQDAEVSQQKHASEQDLNLLPVRAVQLGFTFKRTVSREFYFSFFHETTSPRTLIIQFTPFRISLKACKDISNSILTSGVKGTGCKLQY